MTLRTSNVLYQPHAHEKARGPRALSSRFRCKSVCVEESCIGSAARPAPRAPSARCRRPSRPCGPASRSRGRPSPAVIEEIFARFHKANAEPKGELEYVNPFTLLVAVVLSAQATDAGVNKATRPLFAIADTPQKMLALGEDKVRDMVKTIGLFRTKAKNVVELSRQLIERFGGQVPQDRDALVTLPGVGRKTANVVLNMAFGQETMAVDTHIFRVSNRLKIAPGKTPEQVEAGPREARAQDLPAARAPLAHPARPLHVQGAAPRMRALHRLRPVHVARQANLTPRTSAWLDADVGVDCCGAAWRIEFVLGPNDIEDWEFDRRDLLSMLLRGHSAIHGLASGRAQAAAGVPQALQDVAVSFARQAFLPMEDLELLAAALDLTA